MSDKPSMYLLLALVPYVHLIDDIEDEKLAPMIADTIANTENVDGDAAAAIAEIREHLVPLRNFLKKKKVSELRKMVKDDFGLRGHSRTKENELIQVLITLDLEERQRHATLTEEEREKTAAAVELVKQASDAEKARIARESAGEANEADPPEVAAKPAPAPSKPPAREEPVKKAIQPYQIKKIEVLVQFYTPTIVKKGKTKIPSASPIAKSIYRGQTAQIFYEIALNRDKKEPGFLADHVKVLEIHGG